MNDDLQQRVQHIENLLAALMKSDRYTVERDMQLFDGRNLQLASATGTKIGTAATQKLGFYGATPVVQQTANNRGGFAVGGGATITDLATFPSGAGGTKYTIADVVVALQNLGFLAP